MGFSDPVDHSSEVEDRLREYQVQQIRKQARLSMPYTGACYYCSSDVPSPKVFCDATCRNDYEYLQKMNRISGKR